MASTAQDQVEEPSLEEFLRLPDVQNYQDPSIRLESGFSEFAIIDNIPVVDQSKIEKLRAVILKHISPIPLGSHGLHLPTDESGSTLGYAFVHLASQQAAQEMIDKLNNFKLDKNHTFRTNAWADFSRIQKLTNAYTAPDVKPYKPRENPISYLLDSRGRDQYVVRHGPTTAILWQDPIIDHQSIYSRDNWTDDRVEWSPLGTYLITYHRQGVIVWDGTNWSELNRFQHPSIRFAQFSPCEKYLMTFCPLEKDNAKEPQSIVMWDVLSGRRLRSFTGPKDVWPAFKWSSDGAYFARIDREKSSLDIYQSSTMLRVDKEGFVIQNIQDFSWSTSDNTICYWIPEKSGLPGRLVLINPITKVELRQKSILNIKNLRMVWHDKGDYLAVVVEKVLKKVTTTAIEVFRMRQKAIPNESLEVKDQLIHFAWEPKSHRFSIIHGDSNKADLSLYELTEKQLKLTKTFEKKQINQVHWSPAGRFAVFSVISGSSGGVYEFFDASNMESYGTQDHIMSTPIGWDYNGRYFITAVFKFKSAMDNGFNVWNVAGQSIASIQKDRLEQIIWRPRRPSLLTPEQEKAVQKDYKNLLRKYKEVDEAIAEEFAVSKDQERQARRAEWDEYMQSRQEEINDLAKTRQEHMARYANRATAVVEIVEEIEELIEQTTEVLA